MPDIPEVKIDPKVNLEPYEAHVYEKRCGHTVLGDEIYLIHEGRAFACMLGNADAESRAKAAAITAILNDASPQGARPAKIVREDRGKRYDEECIRNAEHIAKTIDLNMKLSQEKWESIYHLWHRVRTNNTCADAATTAERKAVRWAAELYALRSFVAGVIRGRLHKMAEGHIESQVAKWEDKWDQAFGDLVGEILNMQD